MTDPDPGATFFAPGVKNPGPHTECYSCSAWLKDHVGPHRECPARIDEGEILL